MPPHYSLHYFACHLPFDSPLHLLLLSFFFSFFCSIHSFLTIPIVSWIIHEYVLLGVTIFYCLILRKLETTDFMSEELADHNKRLMEIENENISASEDIKNDVFSVKCGDEGAPIPEAGAVQV